MRQDTMLKSKTCNQKDPYTLQLGGIKPDHRDVLLSRTKSAFMHEGNRKFRVMIASKVAEYKKGNRREKSQLIASTVDDICSSQGRFLRYVKGSWLDAGVKAGRDKVAHAFRDTLNNKYQCVRALVHELHSPSMSLVDTLSHPGLPLPFFSGVDACQPSLVDGGFSPSMLDPISRMEDLDDILNDIDPPLESDDILFVELDSPSPIPSNSTSHANMLATYSSASTTGELLASSKTALLNDVDWCPPDSQNIDTFSGTKEDCFKEAAEFLLGDDIFASMALASFEEIDEEERLLSSYLW